MRLFRRFLFGALLLLGSGLFADGSLDFSTSQARVVTAETLRCLPVVPEPSVAVVGGDLVFALAVPWPAHATEMGYVGTYDGIGLFSVSKRVVQLRSKAASYFHVTTLFQGREYDFDLALYNYRARYYDPRMGRFLQTDPLGYHDSMNLYQGMGMNPVNYMDPFGLATINLFIGFQLTDENRFGFKIPHNGKMYTQFVEHPSFDSYRDLAKANGHTLNVFVLGDSRFSKSNIDKSLSEEDTWTFYVGHSNLVKGTKNTFNGINLHNGDGSEITLPRNNIKNEYMGVFGCGSSQFIDDVFPSASKIFAIQDSDKKRIRTHLNKALDACLALIEYLCINKNADINEAATAATKGIRRIEDEEEDVVIGLNFKTLRSVFFSLIL